MPHIAKLDDQGMLVAVEECCADDHKTCPIARTVALPDNHDMRERGNGYRWDFTRACFLPLSAEPLDAAERDTPELVEGLVQAIEHIQELMQLNLPRTSQRALSAYRRAIPRRRHPADPTPETPPETPGAEEQPAAKGEPA